jgi:hypothetical protein
MLVLVASWAALSVASLLIGLAVLVVVDLSRLDRAADRFLVALWTGLLTLAAGMLALSVAGPLAPFAGPLLAVALSGIALTFGKVRLALREAIGSVSVWPLVGVLGLALGVAFFSAQPVTLYDTGLYHAGAIEWLSRFGSVRGVALLEYRLGFTSSWFALAASLNWGPLTDRIGTVTGGYALLLAAAHFAVAATRLARAQGRTSDWFAFFAYLVVLTWLLRAGMVSPSPDVPVVAVGVLVAWLIVILTGDHDLRPMTVSSVTRQLPAQAAPVLISAGAISLKPTAAPLLLISVLFYLWTSRPNPAHVVALGVISALLVFPVFLASLTTSGCAVFPSPLLCGHVPWSVSGGAAASDQAIGRDFLRWTGAPPTGANSWNWLPHWATSETLGSLLIAYMLASAAALAASAKRIGGISWLWVAGLAVTGVGYVLLLSPTLRFMLAYLVAAPGYLAAVLCSRWRINPLVLIPPLLIAFISVETVTIYDHTNAITPSAVLFALIVPVAGGALAAGYFWSSRISTWKYAVQLLPGLQYPALLLIVGLVFATSNYSLLPRTRHLRVTPDGIAGLLVPPLLPTLARDEQIQHSAIGFTYISPPPGLQVCWALIPCTTDAPPSNLRLLDPNRGAAGGFAGG